jgi:NADPH-dependent ferric siderophore reductase
MSESTTSLAGRARPARPQAVLGVLRRERISPHTVRITAGGPGFGALRMNEFTDKYAKIIFADPSLGLTPPYDLAALRASLPPGRQPVTRTYTLRRADALRAGSWLPGRVDVFAHGERESMKAVRAALKVRLGEGDRLSLSGYWASGRTEDVFQSEKRQPVGQI